MREPLGSLGVAVLALCLSLAPVGAAVATAGPAAAPTVEKTVTVSSVAGGESVRVRYEYSFPDAITEFRAFVYDSGPYRVTNTRGFRRESGEETRVFEWDGNTSSGSLTLRLRRDANPSSDGATASGIGRFDGDSWQFVPLPTLRPAYRYVGEEPTVETERRVAGEGVATETAAYLGPYAERTVTVEGQTVHVVVPAATEPASPPDEITEALAEAERRLPGTPAHSEVYGFALPSRIDSPNAGRAVGGTFWVKDDQRLSRAHNAWFHEYVHTRQGRASGEMEWFQEASAEYVAAALAVQLDYVEYAAAAEHVTSVDDPNATLTDSATWVDVETPYGKGSRVLAALDARVRERTDGSAGMYDVFRDVYDGENATLAAFRSVLADYLGQRRADRFVRRYVAGSDLPEAPDGYLFTFVPDADRDGDGLANRAEHEAGASPFAADTDGDGVGDPRELELGTDPDESDTDGDDIDDQRELELDSDPANPDTDGDGSDDSVDEFPRDPDRSTSKRTLAVLFGLWAVGTVAAVGAVAAALARLADRLLGRGPRFLVRRSVSRLVVVAFAAFALSFAYAATV